MILFDLLTAIKSDYKGALELPAGTTTSIIHDASAASLFSEAAQ